MLAKVISGALVGLESVSVEVEVDVVEKGFPAFSIVGLPDKAIEESKDRVRSAIKNSGADFPPRRITVNLTPADLPKEGPAYDLPIALGILIASGQLEADLSNVFVLGELSLDGSLRFTNGILPMVMLAKELGLKKVFLPLINAKEASVVPKIEVIPISSLLDLYYYLEEKQEIEPHPQTFFKDLNKDKAYEFDLKDIKGQEHAKRALEIAAAGGHNLFKLWAQSNI